MSKEGGGEDQEDGEVDDLEDGEVKDDDDDDIDVEALLASKRAANQPKQSVPFIEHGRPPSPNRPPIWHNEPPQFDQPPPFRDSEQFELQGPRPPFRDGPLVSEIFSKCSIFY